MLTNHLKSFSNFSRKEKLFITLSFVIRKILQTIVKPYVLIAKTSFDLLLLKGNKIL